MASLNSRNSDPQRCTSSSASATKPRSLSDQRKRYAKTKQDRARNLGSMTVDGLLRNVYDSNSATESTLLDAQITLMDAANPTSIPIAAAGTASGASGNNSNSSSGHPKTMDDVWNQIISGVRKDLKEEAPEEMMTLEDFLAKAGAVEEEDVKMPQTERLSGGVFAFDTMPLTPFQALDKVEGAIVGFGDGVDVIGSAGGGRGKRGRSVLEPLDKASQQRQRRMIKNRESAARSRERKQAYQVELESLAVKLEEENERLLKEKAERTKERLKQLMENVIPVAQQRRPPRVLRRTRSSEY